MKHVISIRGLAVGVLMVMLGRAASPFAPGRPGRGTWNDRLHRIEEALRTNDWEGARQMAHALTEEIAERGGGTLGDHRAAAEALGGSVAGPDASVEARMLGRASALLAVAEASLGQREEARWHWYAAQNLSREVVSGALPAPPEAAKFLGDHRLERASTLQVRTLDVLDPVRPELAARPGFREPERLAATYPRRPKDLSGRDRFSHVVFVQITVAADGGVTQPVVVDGGYYPGLIFRAFEALRHWRYRPATLAGAAIAFRYVVPVAFEDDRPAPVDPTPRPVVEGTAVLRRVAGMTVDLGNGALYVADRAASVIYRIGPGGPPAAVAGRGYAGFGGDGESATNAVFNHPTALSLDPRTGELFIADTDNYRIRAISPGERRVQTVAGVGLRGVTGVEVPYEDHTSEALALGRFGGDGGPAAAAELNLPSGVCADPIGILFIADSGNHRVRAINRGTSPVIVMGVEIEAGAIQTVAGTGALGFAGDGGPATRADLAFPTELRLDAAGNLVVVDSFNQRLRMIDRQSGIVHSVAQGTLYDVSPQRAQATWATSIVGLSVTADQELLYTDRVGHAVHGVSRGGKDRVIYEARAREAEFGSIEAGPRGEIYVADVHGSRVLRLEDGKATTYLGGQVPPAPIRFGTNSSLGQ